MDIKVELGASRLQWNDEGLTVHVARRHFTSKQWLRLGSGLAQAQEMLNWLQLPFQAAETEGARWKRIHLDLFSVVVYLLLIPPGHKLVQLLQVIDWGEIDRRCAGVYENAKQGARAYAPQVLYRMLLLMVLYGLSFESSLAHQIETQVAWRWFCGFGILTPIPRAATLCYFRQRLKSAKFEEILGWLIQQCDETGLVSLKDAYFDFTGVRASATPLTPYQRTVVLAKALNAYVAGLDDKSIAAEVDLQPILRQLIIEAAQEVMSESHTSVKKLKPEQLAESLDRLDAKEDAMPRGTGWWQQLCQAVRCWWQQEPVQVEEAETLLSQVAEADPSSPEQEQALTKLRAHLGQVGRALKPSVPHAWGDLAARVGVLSTGTSICGYLAGYLVDGEHNIIVGLVTVAANAAQAPQIKVVLDKTKRLLRRLPRRLGLDSAFDRDQVYEDLDPEPIELFITSRNRRGPKGRFGPEHFLFNEAGELCCPAGQLMKHKYGPYKNGRSTFEGQGCASCPFADQCVPEKQTVRRLQIKVESHRRWLENRAQSQSDEGRYVRHQRFAREGVFGHANAYHNGDRAPYRSGDMNTIADCLTAFVVNLEKLAAHQAHAAAA